MFKLFIPYVHLYSLLFHEQRRCCFVRKVDNKIQGSRHAKQDYQEDKIKVQKKSDKIWNKISPAHKSYFGECPRQSGTNVPLN
jgi:hypothetical protein